MVLNQTFELRPCLALKKTHFWVKFLYLPFSPPLLLFLQLSLCYFHFGLKSCQLMTFKPLFGQITILSLNLVNFRVPRFHVSHLTHETFKLCLQNTLNMSKTARVYFGVLHLFSTSVLLLVLRHLSTVLYLRVLIVLCPTHSVLLV